MADILPFIGTRYNSQLIGNLSKVLAPPYDIITPEQQDELYERHSYNVVRLELSKDKSGDDAFSNRYTRAANTFHTWRSDGILIEDDQPSIYLYEQEFRLPNGETKQRRGLFAMVKLSDYKCGQIKAHEHTFAGPKADRLQLMHATHANFSPIFVVYKDPAREVFKTISEKMKEKPWEEAVDDDSVTHRLWVVHKKDVIMKVREMLKDRELFIADGHHRYETALKFRDDMREETGRKDGRQPFDYMMMYLTDAEQDGLVILPTHRALSRRFMQEVDLGEALEEIGEHFELAEEKVDLAKGEAEGKRLADKIARMGADGAVAFCMVQANGKALMMKLKPGIDPVDIIDDDEQPDVVKRLDVSVLHQYIVNQVFVGNPEYELEDDECSYVRDVPRLFDLLKNRKAGAGFILNSTPLDQVMQIVGTGMKMPHKSTYFHPKIITGLVIRNMDCEMAHKVKTGRR